MLLKLCFSLFLLINLTAVILAADRFSRDDFPPGFVFGSGSSAYQVSVANFKVSNFRKKKEEK
jgi:beta-glucosidase